MYNHRKLYGLKGHNLAKKRAQRLYGTSNGSVLRFAIFTVLPRTYKFICLLLKTLKSFLSLENAKKFSTELATMKNEKNPTF